MVLNDNYTLLVIAEDEFVKNLLINENFQVEYFQNLIDAKNYYQENDLNIDLIINMFDYSIKYKFEEEIIAILDSKDILNQIQTLLKTYVKEQDFNKNLALSMLDNNERIYYNSLKRYVNEYHDLENIINLLLQDNNYNQIREYVHKIKGFSMYLGSEKLYQISKALEQRIVSKQATNDDIKLFINYNNRILKYSEEQVK